MKKKIIIAVLILATIFLGFLRDYIFISINHFIDLGSDVGGRLFLMKWVLTFLFSILYLLITCAFIYILFYSKKFIWIAVFFYAMLFAVALLSAAFGYFFASFESVYPFIRTVLGIAQSPVVMMVLIPAYFLSVKASVR